MTNLDSIFKSRDIILLTKVHLGKAMVFPVVIYGCELDCEESWAPKNWCFWTVVLEKTLESPLDCKGIQPVHSEGDQPWDFFGRNDAKAEAPVLWPPHAKSWLIEKTLLLERESEWTPGAGDGQGGLAFCNSWGCKESDTTEWLNWNKHLYILLDCNGGNMGVYTCQNLIELYILNGSILFF